MMRGMEALSATHAAHSHAALAGQLEARHSNALPPEGVRGQQLPPACVDDCGVGEVAVGIGLRAQPVLPASAIVLGCGDVQRCTALGGVVVADLFRMVGMVQPECESHLV